MRVVETLVPGDDADLVEAHLAFQLAAGVDLVLAATSATATVNEVVDAYAAAGVTRIAAPATSPDAVRADLVDRAIETHEATWVLESTAREFWWPRGESLQDVLVAIPPRYGVVQGLRRPLVRPASSGGAMVGELDLRVSVHMLAEGGGSSLQWLLVPVMRAPSGHQRSSNRLPAGQPLRAWYPIEVLTVMSGNEPEVRAVRPADDGEADALVAAGALAHDERLRRTLAALRRDGARQDRRRYLVPAERESEPKLFTVPDIVDDAAYAGECADVGEVDLDKIDRYITELEHRIAWLERRLWPRVRRKLAATLRR